MILKRVVETQDFASLCNVFFVIVMHLLFRILRALALSLAVLVASFAVVFAVRTREMPTVDSSREMLSKVIPALDRSCRFPLSYRMGAIDPRFHLSDAELAEAIREAEAIWERGLGRELFERSDEATAMPIHLVFDARQARTESLKEASSDIEVKRVEFEKLQREYEGARSDFDAEKSAYDTRVDRYEESLREYEERAQKYADRFRSYEEQVVAWNAEGGAPPDEFEELEDRRESLKKESSALEKARGDLNDEKKSLEKMLRALNVLAGKVNTIGGSLNRLATTLNVTVDSYNRVYGVREEFTTGLYTEEHGEARIEVFQFYDHDDLVLILAHEMGHALGVEHASDPASLMHPSIGGQLPVLSDEDRNLFAKICPM